VIIVVVTIVVLILGWQPHEINNPASSAASSCNAAPAESSWQKEARNFWGKVCVVAGLVETAFTINERIPPIIIVVVHHGVHPEKSMDIYWSKVDGTAWVDRIITIG